VFFAIFCRDFLLSLGICLRYYAYRKMVDVIFSLGGGNQRTNLGRAAVFTCVDIIRMFGSSSSRLSHLHWLPVHRRIQFKIALITYKTLSTDELPYLSSLLHPYRPSRSLRSANRNLLLIPSIHPSLFAQKNFNNTHQS